MTASDVVGDRSKAKATAPLARAIIFDRDGTLVRYDEEWLLATLRQARPDLTLTMLNGHWGKHAHLMPATPEGEPLFWLTLWRLFVQEHGGTVEQAEELARIAVGYHRAFHPFPDTLPCLTGLSVLDVRLAVLTNHPMVSVAATLRNAGIDPEWFDVLVNAYPEAKPSSAAYHKILAALRLPAEHCLLVDDEPDNVRGALAVGMPAVLLDRKGTYGGALPVIQRLIDVLPTAEAGGFQPPPTVTL